jgi:hypothetical protein
VPLLALGQVACLPRRVTRLIAVAAAVARAEARISQRAASHAHQCADDRSECKLAPHAATSYSDTARTYASAPRIATFDAGFKAEMRSGNDSNITRTPKRVDIPQARAAAAVISCDFCGSPRSPLDRQRLVWNSGAETELTLADLCGRCAADADRLLDQYGGHGRNNIRLTRDERVASSQKAFAPKLARALLYLLVALAFFVLVTLISSLR